jgi:hypothetical protein
LLPEAKKKLEELIDFVRSESAAVMREIDSGTSNLRNAVYQLAQINLTLADIVTELVRAEKESKPDDVSSR